MVRSLPCAAIFILLSGTASALSAKDTKTLLDVKPSIETVRSCVKASIDIAGRAKGDQALAKELSLNEPDIETDGLDAAIAFAKQKQPRYSRAMADAGCPVDTGVPQFAALVYGMIAQDVRKNGQSAKGLPISPQVDAFLTTHQQELRRLFAADKAARSALKKESDAEEEVEE